jgi:hypothetical protein
MWKSSICGVLAFHHCDKISEKINLKQKDLFWVMASEFSMYGELALLLLGLL